MEKFNGSWDKLRLFYEIAKAGSFNAAAETLNISQPALSRSINILEEQIKYRLFERLPRGLALTRHGEILLEVIRKMYSEIEDVLISLDEESNEPVGSIRIASTAGFAASHLPLVLPKFLRSHPNIRISIFGSDILPNLHSNEADVVIAPFIASDDSLVQIYLTTFHLKLYASKAYLDTYGVPHTSADLSHHLLLAFGDHKTSHPFGQANWHLTVGLEKGMIRQPYIMINSAIGLFNFAESGMGIICVAQEHPALKQSSLQLLLPDLESPTIEAYYIYSTRNKKIKRIELLKKFLQSEFKPDS